jgi:hypothetical protein
LCTGGSACSVESAADCGGGEGGGWGGGRGGDGWIEDQGERTTPTQWGGTIAWRMWSGEEFKAEIPPPALGK